MRVFITGAAGFIGTAVTRNLLQDGHQVLGLARSEANVKALQAAGAEVHRGDLENPESLRAGAAQCDGVIHLGFVHDFSRFQEICEIDRRAIETLGSALAGSDRPLLVTSGVGLGIAAPGQLATEDYFNVNHPHPRAVSEIASATVSAAGGNVRVVRLPQVHDPIKQGLVTYLVALAREKGISAYVGEGTARWSAVALSDAARVYQSVLEKGSAGLRYHPVGEEGVPSREIAEAIGRGLKVPVVSLSGDEVAPHFGWLAMFAGADMSASSKLTQERLGWHPTGPGLISDLDRMDYSVAA